ncbi:chemotaxis protein CheA [Aeromonas hydrophila]|uniref:chemotaxis protein CheA n=1 Tax=Aeromonas hydrophila TaxID=644 RepID=UPI0004D94B05|nr:chemotaxis protein CheA [Aeromonas hydrophila]EJN6954154.1 chemotaxis protein CheA [Aeromonas hydrophila]KER64153.1 chemotaxis protein CheA [Aeromonas hydrophila]MCX4040925.1 chemotaxis protein CheA [Aeromonas hydrophila]OCA66781.1 chemotaxis protein CheA [Aeromonas hydrophila]OCY06768.1 chemotaxis protein CheA [Aeromonas hydrophila]
MSINLDQALQTYIAEARELLEEMESALLTLENEPDNSELIGAIFRAAHTIKGSAGLFGLQPIVSFTHIVEDLLDQVRNQQLTISEALIKDLLESRDHIERLVSLVAEQGEALGADEQAQDEQLRSDLARHQTTSQTGLPERNPPAETSPVSKEEGHVSATSLWHISLRFGPDVLRNGMDPTSFLRYLGTLGTLCAIETIHHALPVWEHFDPESCYLGYELDLDTQADKNALSDVFEFVRDDCRITIIPPHSKLAEYIDLINALPEDNEMLGQLLVKTGALTASELVLGLQAQHEQPQTDAGKLGEILIAQGAVSEVVVDAALKKQSQNKESKNKEGRYVRVHADKLDDLINLVGELVVASSGANLLAQRSRDSQLQEANSTIAMLVEEIRDGALRLRMVPIGDTFNRFQRVVRDVSHELDKDIALVITGGDTELDKSVVEKIGDPLMHLVRNAMDHGIESAERRVAAGKPARGTLTLNAYHDSGSIVIEIQDDGAGLNKARILQKAQERGLVTTNATLTDQEIYQLIFEPGFSTAEAITNLSGRGVGMDVVKRNIQALRGSVELDSKPGLGTRVQIRLPLTLAIIDGFLVRVSTTHYVIPLDMVIECVELTQSALADTQGRNYINLRGEVLPFVRLQHYFDVEGTRGRRENIVVVSHGGKKSGLVVDELLGEFQTVIKPLGKLFQRLQGISGSTILGGGEVALILDIPSLIQHSIEQELGQLSQYAIPRLQTQPRVN